MNPELVIKASAKVGNPNFLINIVSRRVRQLNSGGGASSRPLLTETAGMGAADIAMAEVLEDKMGWEEPAAPVAADPVPKKKRKSSRSHH